ncbi:MAG: threonine/serine dehydratase [Pseudomonadota bacterium]
MPDASALFGITPDDFSIDQINEAAGILKGNAVRTPLLRSPALDELTGGTVLVKAEPLQRTGSFKFRGAFTRISKIPEAERGNGVVAFSSGNHAQGVAAAAALNGIAAAIVMPADAPRMKVENTKSYGATVVPYDRYTEDRGAIAREIQNKTGATLVAPFDDPWVTAGQGTCGLENSEQAKEYGLSLDAALICAGGGGLSSGTGTAVRHHFPEAQVYTVEPEGFEDTKLSLEAGAPVKNDPSARSICDALLIDQPGFFSLPVLMNLKAKGLAVSDDEALSAMAFAYHHLKVVVEPGGAVCLAALLAQKLDVAGKTVAITLSGGNVDPKIFARALDLLT